MSTPAFALLSGRPATTFRWTFGGREYQLDRTPWLMGILNVTPDSFSDGGRYYDVGAGTVSAVKHGLELVAQGLKVADQCLDLTADFLTQ